MPTRTGRGFTLIELVVTLAVSAAVIVGVIGVVNSQQRAYAEGSRVRAAQASARAAILELERAASVAGYGLDASLALDLDRYSSGPCPSQLSPCRRDAIDNSDELVFYRKNSRYWVPNDYGADPVGRAWRVRGLTANTIKLYIRGGDMLLKGQILQAVCKGGTKYAYMTVATTTKPDDTVLSTSGTLLDVPLVAAVSTDPFKRQDFALAETCFTDAVAPARVFAIDRYRFHVRPVAQADGTLEPYLVLDMGVDTDRSGTIDASDEVLLAEGVELMQVGYVMRNTALGTLGQVPGTQIAFTQGALGVTTGTGLTTLQFPGTVQAGQTAYQPTSWYTYPLGPPPSANRLTNHQANVVALRIGLLVRSPTPERGLQGGDPPLPFYNLSAIPAWIDQSTRYARVRIDTTIPLRNMSTRGIADF